MHLHRLLGQLAQAALRYWPKAAPGRHRRPGMPAAGNVLRMV
jgi:hypothetical protein